MILCKNYFGLGHLYKIEGLVYLIFLLINTLIKLKFLFFNINKFLKTHLVSYGVVPMSSQISKLPLASSLEIETKSLRLSSIKENLIWPDNT